MVNPRVNVPNFSGDCAKGKVSKYLLKDCAILVKGIWKWKKTGWRSVPGRMTCGVTPGTPDGLVTGNWLGLRMVGANHIFVSYIITAQLSFHKTLQISGIIQRITVLYFDRCNQKGDVSQSKLYQSVTFATFKMHNICCCVCIVLFLVTCFV